MLNTGFRLEVGVVPLTVSPMSYIGNSCLPTLGSVDLAILLPRAEILSPGVLKKKSLNLKL